MKRVAEKLALDSQYVFPAFEDAFYYMWRERRLPGNVDPFDSRVDDALERDRLMKVFTQGLACTVGHILPIMKNPWGQWQTGPWFLRAERCYLFPGDSAMGYRLPIDSQPWASKSDYPYVNPPDPAQPGATLRSSAEIRRQFAEPLRSSAPCAAPASASSADSLSFSDVGKGKGKGEGTASNTPPGFKESAGWITRLAMCAEAREGKLYIFMPPTEQLDDYLELVAAVRSTAEEMQMPVVMEGYEPPSDPRMTHFRVTPDPGVIEVNIHPAKSWDQLVEQTTHLYDAAHITRLTTEKFMVDGRHTGTGAATTLCSAGQRRPIHRSCGGRIC